MPKRTREWALELYFLFCFKRRKYRKETKGWLYEVLRAKSLRKLTTKRKASEDAFPCPIDLEVTSSLFRGNFNACAIRNCSKLSLQDLIQKYNRVFGNQQLPSEGRKAWLV